MKAGLVILWEVLLLAGQPTSQTGKVQAVREAMIAICHACAGSKAGSSFQRRLTQHMYAQSTMNSQTLSSASNCEDI